MLLVRRQSCLIYSTTELVYCYNIVFKIHHFPLCLSSDCLHYQYCVWYKRKEKAEGNNIVDGISFSAFTQWRMLLEDSIERLPRSTASHWIQQVFGSGSQHTRLLTNTQMHTVGLLISVTHKYKTNPSASFWQSWKQPKISSHCKWHVTLSMWPKLLLFALKLKLSFIIQLFPQFNDAD